MRPLPLNCRRFFNTCAEILQEGDRALLRHKDIVFLTKPLRPYDKLDTHHGVISHNCIIGKRVRDLITTNTGLDYRVNFPTLEEYVTMTPRFVTPIYPQYANLMVSLLDIHASPQIGSVKSHPELEILEAGTGHGSLTIHLARAIHAANPLWPEKKARFSLVTNDNQPPGLPHSSTITDRLYTDLPPSTVVAEDQDNLTKDGEIQQHRHAVIHTVDISSRNLKQARKLIREFRRGQYANDVEFHASEVSAWIDQQLTLRGKHKPELIDKTFLSHIILDLPKTHQHLEKAASVLHVDGRVLVFCPSITQIIACVKEIENKQLLLELDQVLEVGDGVAGGRGWDVRAVHPKAHLREEQKRQSVNPVEPDVPATDKTQGTLGIDQRSLVNESSEQDRVAATFKEELGWEIICRPKIKAVGTGGGFMGLWRKMRRT
ncbi:hypothetical protein MMC07_009134 [Pseudocyphellaria aurata]|nr:hypothetical protein [Pseudocyphellaria aurata]